MTATTRASGSARRHGELWGARAGDWAEIETQQVPTYEEALRRVDVPPGRLVLDIGCGAGVFLRVAADRGLRTFGLDASEALLALARTGFRRPTYRSETCSSCRTRTAPSTW